MKIAVASDHAGFDLKQAICDYLSQQKIDVIDLGPKNADRVDYPDFAKEVALLVSKNKAEAGILICGTGLGMMITAGKFKNVRPTLAADIYTARMAKEHNNANVLGLGARTTDFAKAKRIVAAWLKSKFKEGRHQDRLDKISKIEKDNFK